MNNRILVLAVMLLGSALSACSNMNYPSTPSPKEYIGMLTGAVVGGVAGNAVNVKGGAHYTAIAVGTVVGALIGGGIGMVLNEKYPHKTAELAIEEPMPTELDNASAPPIKKTQHAAKKKSAVLSSNRIAQSIGLSNKRLGFWHTLPSTQWFVDDGNTLKLG